MPQFKDIVGQKGIKSHFAGILETGNIPHAYILAGDRRSGRRFIAGIFGQALVCTDLRKDPVTGMTEPCCKCSACIRAMKGEHPDIRIITPDKTISVSVDDIRGKLVSDVLKKPFEASRKLYIIPDSDRMGHPAQNAMLKTLEEPPGHATVMLLAENPEQFLPTVRSRAMLLTIRPAGEDELVSYLMSAKHVVDYRARTAAAFAAGNTGLAIGYAENDAFEEYRAKVVRLLDELPRLDTSSMMARIRELTAPDDGGDKKTDRNKVTELLGICSFFFRDVLIYKAERMDDHLIMKDLSAYISKAAESMSYSRISDVMKKIAVTGDRIRANVSTELALELLFLDMR